MTASKAAKFFGDGMILEPDRAERLVHLFATAVEMLDDEDKATEWLKTPNPALCGARPLDQLDSELNMREAEDILGRIAYGVYS